MRYHAVPDLGGFLQGSWVLTRRIIDRRDGNHARFVGRVRFAPGRAGAASQGAASQGAASQGYDCLETGEISMAHYRGPAQRKLKLVLFRADRGTLRFSDGRPFVGLDLSNGRCILRHPCGADLYTGRAWAAGRDDLWLSWRVRGPRKDMLIAGRYRRLDRDLALSA